MITGGGKIQIENTVAQRSMQASTGSVVDVAGWGATPPYREKILQGLMFAIFAIRPNSRNFPLHKILYLKWRQYVRKELIWYDYAP